MGEVILIMGRLCSIEFVLTQKLRLGIILHFVNIHQIR